jgi:quinol monooxygenase YgiN
MKEGAVHVVTVAFEIVPEHAGAFLEEMAANAKASREREPGCRQFDVCVRRGEPAFVFLYEVYDDRAAFEAHMRTVHFKAFERATTAWVVKKIVRELERFDPRD